MVSVNGTSLQGHITTTYDKLVEVFGPPQFTDSTYYKNFTVYCWKYGRIPTEECEWNIGGKDFESWSDADDIINAKN